VANRRQQVGDEALEKIIAEAGHAADFKKSPMLNSDQNDHNRSQNIHAWRTILAPPIAKAVLASKLPATVPPEDETTLSAKQFEEQADRIVMGEAINGDRSWHEFARDQTTKVLSLEAERDALKVKLAQSEASATTIENILSDTQDRLAAVGQETPQEIWERAYRAGCKAGAYHLMIDGVPPYTPPLKAGQIGEHQEFWCIKKQTDGERCGLQCDHCAMARVEADERR